MGYSKDDAQAIINGCLSKNCAHCKALMDNFNINKTINKSLDWTKSYQIDPKALYQANKFPDYKYGNPEPKAIDLIKDPLAKLLSEPLPFKQFVKPEKKVGFKYYPDLKNDKPVDYFTPRSMKAKLEEIKKVQKSLADAINYLDHYAELSKKEHEQAVKAVTPKKVKKKKGVSHPSKDDFKL